MIWRGVFKNPVSADFLKLICIYRGLKMKGVYISISQMRKFRHRAQREKILLWGRGKPQRVVQEKLTQHHDAGRGRFLSITLPSCQKQKQ